MASVPNMHVRRVFFLEIAVLVGFSLQHGGAAARVSRRHTPPAALSVRNGVLPSRCQRTSCCLCPVFHQTLPISAVGVMTDYSIARMWARFAYDTVAKTVERGA